MNMVRRMARRFIPSWYTQNVSLVMHGIGLAFAGIGLASGATALVVVGAVVVILA